MGIEYGSLTFLEAIAFFNKKLNLPSARWADVWHGLHTRVFTVAGAMQEDLLADLRGAVAKAMEEGTTLRAFQKDFDKIVKRHGWTYNGGRGWRTRIILGTNIKTSYAAGRYKQMTDPDVLKRRPFWEYRHGDSREPRPEHLEWSGKVLSADDPWWKTHYPPNGWGCS